MDIVPIRRMIQQEETAPQAGLTESMLSRVGAGINFINSYHFYTGEFKVNGYYNGISLIPNLSVDGFFTYPYNYEIMDIIIKIGSVNITSGLTEIDLKWYNGVTWVSIFSTTPKWTSSAAADSYIRIGATATGWTAPVLDKDTFDAYDLIKMDILQAGGGSPNGFECKVFVRPISA